MAPLDVEDDIEADDEGDENSLPDAKGMRRMEMVWNAYETLLNAF